MMNVDIGINDQDRMKIGEVAPGTYKAFVQLSSIDEVDGVPTAN